MLRFTHVQRGTEGTENHACNVPFESLSPCFANVAYKHGQASHHWLSFYSDQCEVSASMLRFSIPWQIIGCGLQPRLCESSREPTQNFSHDNIKCQCSLWEPLLSFFCQVRVSLWQWCFRKIKPQVCMDNSLKYWREVAKWVKLPFWVVKVYQGLMMVMRALLELSCHFLDGHFLSILNPFLSPCVFDIRFFGLQFMCIIIYFNCGELSVQFMYCGQPKPWGIYFCTNFLLTEV